MRPDEAPEFGYGTRPKCEARRQKRPEETTDPLVRCGMPSREVVTYLGQPRSLCAAHAKRYAEWGERDREQMARAIWGWPTAGELGEERSPSLEGMPPASPRRFRAGA